jgi:serine phosphatase RsbU (regulator of sigma subunit)
MVLVSDGIRMARNGQDVQVGVERTSEAVRRACEAGLPAAETIDRILADVEAFRERKGPADMTFVVVVVN